MKFPRIKISQVAIDGIGGFHVKLIVGGFICMVTFSWSKQVTP